MKSAAIILVLILLGMPGHALAEEIAPASADRDDAGWADRAAQGRMIDGDYDGALVAEAQADAERRKAERENPVAHAEQH